MRRKLNLPAMREGKKFPVPKGITVVINITAENVLAVTPIEEFDSTGCKAWTVVRVASLKRISRSSAYQEMLSIRGKLA